MNLKEIGCSEIINKIDEIVNWYYNNSRTASIDNLLGAQDKVITLCYTLVEYLADYNEKYHRYYYIRKIKISTIKNALVKKGEGVTAAESIATESAAEELDQEMANECLAHKLDLQIKQANKLTEKMTQRIAYLRAELENSRKIQ